MKTLLSKLKSHVLSEQEMAQVSGADMCEWKEIQTGFACGPFLCEKVDFELVCY